MHILYKIADDSKKDRSIQILRFIAAVGIIIYHAGVVKGGYFGVDIFFILSGYVMMLSTEKRSNNFFLIKRLIRIVPLYWGATLVMYILLLKVPQLSIMSEAGMEYLIKSLLFIPFVNSKGYSVPLLSIGWTLNYEIYFYIIFGIVLKITHKNRMYYSSIIILILSVWGKISDNFYISYIGDTVMLEFIFGMILYQLQKMLRKKEIEHLGRVFPLGMSVIICGVLWYITCRRNVEERWIALGIPAFILCFVFMNCKKDILPELMSKLGDITYSVYIVEFFTTAVYKVIFSTMESALVKVLGLVLLVISTYFIAMFSYKIVEQDLVTYFKHNLIKNE